MNRRKIERGEMRFEFGENGEEDEMGFAQNRNKSGKKEVYL